MLFVCMFVLKTIRNPSLVMNIKSKRELMHLQYLHVCEALHLYSPKITIKIQITLADRNSRPWLFAMI